MTLQKKVLIIEDDTLMQVLLAAQLKRTDYSVVGVASTGKEGLEKLHALSPDIVFVDIGLPDINGIELIKTIQKEKSVAIIVLSSEYRIEYVQDASDAGALAYLVKPPEIQQVERSIAIALTQFKHQLEMKNLNELLKSSIEEKKHAEILLLESEKKFRALAENATDIIIRHDTDGRFLYANPAFEKQMLIGVDNIIGRELDYFINDKEKNAYYKALFQRVIESGLSAQCEITFTNPRRVFDWSMVAEFDGQNRLTSVLSTIRNITELRDAQDRLFQLEKMQAIGQLASGIAHDFNNKLGTILGYADILMESFSEDDRRKKYSDAIVKAAQYASDLTNQLLAFAHKGKVKNILVDMHVVLRDLVSFLESTLNKKIKISTSFLAVSPFVMGDPLILKNAFLNITLNANDAMPNGGELTITTSDVVVDAEYINVGKVVLTQGCYLKVSVNDTGYGIDSEIIKRIFEPFFTTKEAGKGTGLGLPAVYGIVKSHFGAIDVISELGNGAAFDLYLPKASSEDVCQCNDIQIDESNGRLTILVIDDNELIREMAAGMFTKMGYNVILSRDGTEAIKLYNVHWKKIELVFIDIMMPGIDGYDTYLQLKSINPWIKAFFISGYSTNEKTNRFLAEGVLGVIQKPFRVNEVKNCLSINFNNVQD